MKSRAIRRHHEQRNKRRVRDYYCGVFRQDEKHIGKLSHTRTPCSCFMCGNPRKFERQVTMRERRVSQREQGDNGL